MADRWANLPYRINDCATWADCLNLADEVRALANGSSPDPHREQLEAILDNLLDGIDRYRTSELLGTAQSKHLGNLVDMANEARNNLNRAALTPQGEPDD